MLVVVGFVPPLLELRGKVSRAVAEEMTNLRRRLDRALTREASARGKAAPGGDAARARGASRRGAGDAAHLLPGAAARQLGQSEATDIVIKLLVPITTMAWYGYKYYTGMP